MEPKFKSSFIPKGDSVISSGGAGKLTYKPSGRGVLDRLGTALFVLVLVVWGGLFGYQKYVEAQIVSLEKDIVEARSLIDQDKVDLFVALGKQVRISKELLARHVSLTPLFELLEQNTVPSVQFTEFDFSLSSSGDVSVESIGRAQNFADVVRQEEVLSDVNKLTDMTIGQVSVDGDVSEGVAFKLNFTVSREGVLYAELVKDLINPEVPIENIMFNSDGEELTTPSSSQEVSSDLSNDVTEIES